MNKALVIFAHGKGFVISWKAEDSVTRFIEDAGGNQDGFDLELVGVDFTIPADGLWVGDLKLIDDGPGDWPGSREFALQIYAWRPGTTEEWASFRAGEWPWSD